MSGAPRILVTGARGFVGSWLTARLADALPPGAALLPVGHGTGSEFDVDITAAADVDRLVARVRPTCVVHLAAVSSLVRAAAASRNAWDVNLFGTMNLAEAVMRHVPDARFVFTGSSEVYGGAFNVAGGVVDETARLEPLNPYAATKAAADLMLGQMAGAGLRAVRLRPFNHTGPGQSTAFAVPAFAAQIAAIERGERPPVLKVGNLDARRDLLDVRDVVEAYVSAVTIDDLPRGLVLNVASGEARRMGDVLDQLLAMSRCGIRVERDEALMRPSDIPVTIGDASRARAILAWAPRIPWLTTLRDTVEAHRRGAG